VPESVHPLIVAPTSSALAAVFTRVSSGWQQLICAAALPVLRLTHFLDHCLYHVLTLHGFLWYGHSGVACACCVACTLRLAKPAERGGSGAAIGNSVSQTCRVYAIAQHAQRKLVFEFVLNWAVYVCSCVGLCHLCLPPCRPVVLEYSSQAESI